MIDVREPDEYAAGHVPGAVLIPLGHGPRRTSTASGPTGRPTSSASPAGAACGRASIASGEGYDVVNVTGGTGAWIASGHDVVVGESRHDVPRPRRPVPPRAALATRRSQRRQARVTFRWVDDDVDLRELIDELDRRAEVRPRHRVPPRAHVLPAARPGPGRLAGRHRPRRPAGRRPGAVRQAVRLRRRRRAPRRPAGPRRARPRGRRRPAAHLRHPDRRRASSATRRRRSSMLVQGELGADAGQGRPAHRLAAPAADGRPEGVRRRRRALPARPAGPPRRQADRARAQLGLGGRGVRRAALAADGADRRPRMPGLGSRTPARCGRGRGPIAQAVAAWREREAQALDMPVRQVLPDLAILGIAQRQPATLDELAQCRGVDDRHSSGAHRPTSSSPSSRPASTPSRRRSATAATTSTARCARR